MTDQERQQRMDDLAELAGMMEFRVSLTDSMMARIRREFVLMGVLFFLSGMLYGGLLGHWLWR